MSDIPVTVDEVEIIVAFIKNHEREDIPDYVWDVCMRWQERLDNIWYEN